MLKLLKSFLLVSASVIGAIAEGQSFNVDVDLFNSSPIVGSGAPSSAFGAAAAQTGFWNALPTGFPGPFALRGLSGEATSVSVAASGMGGGFGFNNPVNTGDFNFLLNDGDTIGEGFHYTISGLVPGIYRVFTYAVRANGGHGSAAITVTGSITPNPQVVSGTMPGNEFILLRTHSIHEVHVADGSIHILASGTLNDVVNGFQIVSVPEPTALGVSSGTLLTMLLSRRRKV